MYPILGRYGPFFFYSYTAVMGLGLLAAVGLSTWQARRTQSPARWPNGLLLALFAALLGGRLAFVLMNWVYFQEHMAQAWFLWRGGLSYHGALVAGLLGLWLWCLLRGVAFGPIAGLLAPAAALWSAFGWLACYLEGCAYGRETFIRLLAADLPDSYGVYAVRYQTQLLGVVVSLLAFGFLWWLRERLRPLTLFWLALLLLSLGRFVVSFFRGDPAPLLNGVRLDTMFESILIALALVALLLSRHRAFR